MKILQNQVNIIPVIAKIDTCTKMEFYRLQRTILAELHKENIKIYEIPEPDDDEEEEFKQQTRVLMVRHFTRVAYVSYNLMFKNNV